MWAHPGKKLLFMGGELAQAREWNHDAELNWAALQDALHLGVQLTVDRLNRCYRDESALHELDADPAGFQWLVGDDRANSVFAFCRRAASDASPLVAACNFTPVPRHGYRIGVPRPGPWRERLNTDAAEFGGSGIANAELLATATPSHGQPYSLTLTLPPLATVYLQATRT
jgi:1,4-alpha-glucan branching enzyme